MMFGRIVLLTAGVVAALALGARARRKADLTPKYPRGGGGTQTPPHPPAGAAGEPPGDQPTAAPPPSPRPGEPPSARGPAPSELNPGSSATSSIARDPAES